MRDLSIESYEYLTSKKSLDRFVEYLRDAQVKTETDERFSSAIARGVFPDMVADAKDTIRGMGDAVNLPQYTQAFETLDVALSLVSRAFSPTHLDFNDFTMRFSAECWSDVRDAISSHENPYTAFLMDAFLPGLSKDQPDIVGISVNYVSQFIPALTIANMLATNLPARPFIVLGGSLITHLGDELCNLTELFDLIDACVMYAGEEPFRMLCEARQLMVSINQIPGVICRQGGFVVCNSRVPHLDVASLPTPDFEGLPLNLYLSPAPVLPLSMSRGCYWRRCRFCSHHRSYVDHHERPAQVVLADMDALSARHGVSHFFFVDECVRPTYLEQLAHMLSERPRSSYRWGVQARFEPGYDEALCGLLAKSGCRLMLFGLESGCQRVLDLMAKGTTLEVADRVIERMNSVGINVWVFFFLGFPGERLSEAEETIDFVMVRACMLAGWTSGGFVLSKHSPVFRNPEAFGLVRLPREQSKELSLQHPFRGADALSDTEVGRLLQKCKATVRIASDAHALFVTPEQFRVFRLSGNGINPSA